MDVGLLVTFAGIVVAGLAGVLGVWMERDPHGPRRWAYVFSSLIVVATFVEMGHAILQSAEDSAIDEASSEVLDQLSALAEQGDNPALQQFVGAEMAAQARNNPRMMARLEQRAAARGVDPATLRRKVSEGRRAAAGLPARTGKAGKAGKAPGQPGAPTDPAGAPTGGATPADGTAAEGTTEGAAAGAATGAEGAAEGAAPRAPTDGAGARTRTPDGGEAAGSPRPGGEAGGTKAKAGKRQP